MGEDGVHRLFEGNKESGAVEKVVRFAAERFSQPLDKRPENPVADQCVWSICPVSPARAFRQRKGRELSGRAMAVWSSAAAEPGRDPEKAKGEPDSDEPVILSDEGQQISHHVTLSIVTQVVVRQGRLPRLLSPVLTAFDDLRYYFSR